MNALRSLPARWSVLANVLVVRASQRPRSLFAAVLGLVTFALVLAPSEPASAAPPTCGGGVTGAVCNGAHDLGHLAKKIPGVGGVVDTAEGAYKTVDALSPSNFLDTWAQGLCHAVIFTLTFIESTAEKLGKPAFDQSWWRTQYAVSFGLAMILLAFLLPVVTARVGGSEGSVSGVELLRKSGWRFIFVVPACAFAPAFLYLVQQVASELTKSFATSGAVQANGAVGGLLKLLEKKAGNGWGDFGGTIMAIFFFIFILIAGFILLIEVAVANWGIMLCGLLVPLGLVASVYPPWAPILKRIMGILIGLMFLPVAIFFFWWTVWSGFNSNVTGQGGSNSTTTMLLFLLVSLLAIDISPLIAVWLLSIVAPGTEQMDPSVRGMAPQPAMGEVFNNVFEKPLSGMNGSPTWNGAAQDDSGGGNDDWQDDGGDNPDPDPSGPDRSSDESGTEHSGGDSGHGSSGHSESTGESGGTGGPSAADGSGPGSDGDDSGGGPSEGSPGGGGGTGGPSGPSGGAGGAEGAAAGGEAGTAEAAAAVVVV